MALTMTRNRTQTTLTKLATLIANLHGELAFLEALQKDAVAQGKRAELQARNVKLLLHRDALYATLRQFDPHIDPECIGLRDDWQKQFSKRRLSQLGFVKRYLQKG